MYQHNNLLQNIVLFITDHFGFSSFGKFIQIQDCYFNICISSTGWFVFISTVENIFFGGNGWFQEKTFSWWNLDYLNIFQSIYNHFLIWPTFDLKTASGFQKAGIKKWSFGTHQKLVLIYKSMIEKLTNILQNEICHVQLS